MKAKSKWQKQPIPNVRTEFVFLSVDVIGHSKMFRGHLSNTQMNASHDLLTKLKKFVEECIPDFRQDLEWDWASDGGIFGFPSSEFDRKTTADVLDCAIKIWERLREFEGGKIALHIALDRGDAFFVAEREMRRSDALNTAAKLKSPTGQTAILVTQRIYDDLPQTRARHDFRLQQEPLSDGTRVYAYLRALHDGMGELAGLHAREGQWMEAAHCYYRQGRYLLSGRRMEDAGAAFEASLAAMEKVPQLLRHRYFYHTLRTVCKAWSSLTAFNLRCDFPTPRKFFARGAVRRIFGSSDEWRIRGTLMTHFELISEQLDLLCAKMLNLPIGLSTLETALLLERAGYSPHYFGDALSKRLDRVENDMKASHYRSIDGDCSMCSAAALSALALGGRTKRAEELREWLRLLRQYRYCMLRRDYTDAAPHEHGLHYAANVLQGFLDVAGAAGVRDPEIEQDIRGVLELFFQSTVPDQHDFYEDWMRDRNIDVFEVCSYILPPFVRYVISGRPLSDSQKAHLRTALDTLATNVLREASNKAAPGRLYAARENLGSFALGLFTGMSDEAQKVVEHAFRLFVRRTWSDYPERGFTTLDSNLDRTRRFLEGWLLQWEVILLLRDRGEPIPAYFENVLRYEPLKGDQ